MNKIVLEDNGFPFSATAVRFLQTAASDGIKNLAKAFGEDCILFGCDVNGNAISAGAIVVNGEVIPFEAGTYNAKFTIEETTASVTYKDNVQRAAYYTRVARCSATGSYTLANFPRIRTVKQHTPIDWAALTYDSAVSNDAPSSSVITSMFGSELKAKMSANGDVAICGGGKFRSTTSAYTYTTLPASMRPKSERLIPVTAFVSSNTAGRTSLTTIVGMAKVQTDGKVVIPAELATNGAQEAIAPFFNAVFNVD